ncbi:MAG TPA: N-acetylmuramoyl-L-alanine amidase [Gemmatimonadales bacterium]|nr:N-acetylmuramoyl-L-alanine amidase [Gemmatimonadales bacterium]
MKSVSARGLRRALAPIAVACATADSAIPEVNGPLVLAVRHPIAGAAVHDGRVSTWGTTGNGRATLRVNGRRIKVERNGAFVASLPVPGGPQPTLEFRAQLDDRTVSRRIQLARSNRAAAERRRASGWALVRRSGVDLADSAAARLPVSARQWPDGPYEMSLPIGARFRIQERTSDAVRLRVSNDRALWVSALEVDTTASAPGEYDFGPADSTFRGGVIELSMATPEPVASTVTLTGRQLRWSIFGARDRQKVVTVTLTGPPFGWRTQWTDGKLVLQVRPPRRSAQLKGMVVALDPGHPPGGTVGPTGLREDSVALAVAVAAARKLVRAGARVLLIRADQQPVSLAARTAAAEAADADVYVSIHVDAPSPEDTPWQADGALALYHHEAAKPLAIAMHESISRSMGQPSRGVRHSNLVVLRSAWFPAVLVEGTCLSLPEREALLRTSEGITAYADGITAGLARWTRDSACPDCSSPPPCLDVPGCE